MKSLHFFIFIILALSITIALFGMTIYYNMQTTTGLALHLYVSKYVAAAISSIEHNLNGFIGYSSIYQILFQHGTIDDEILAKAVAAKDIGSGETYKIVTVDLGYCSFAKLSFLLFGYHVKSFVYLYFSILIIGISAFILEFRKNKSALSFLIVILLSLFLTALRSNDMPYNAGVIYGYRFISLLAIIPMLHTCLLILSGKSSTRRISILLLTIQSSIIAWIYHIRLSNKWMVIAIFMLIFINLWFVIGTQSTSKLKLFIKKSIPIFLFLTILLTSKIIMYSSQNDVYRQPSEGAHVFWHSLYLGFALHPKIRKEYTAERIEQHGIDSSWTAISNYRPNDQDAYTAALRWLEKNPKSEYRVFNFKESDNVKYRSIFTYYGEGEESSITTKTYSRKIDMEKDYNWANHELILKGIVFDVLKKFPIEVLQGIFIIKPLKLLNIYLKNFLKTHELKNIKSLIKKFHFILIVFIILFMLALNLNTDFFNIGPLIATTVYLFMFSLIIPLAVYPEPWNMADQAILLTIIIYLFIIAGLGLLIRKLTIYLPPHLQVKIRNLQ